MTGRRFKIEGALRSDRSAPCLKKVLGTKRCGRRSVIADQVEKVSFFQHRAEKSEIFDFCVRDAADRDLIAMETAGL